MTDAVAARPDTREVALLKAVGWDRLSEPQRDLAMGIARTYELDPMLRHLVLIEGKPYITRDGLLHVAHRSGQLDGIEATEPQLTDGFWRSTCSVYRKDMARPFTYTGRYPATGGNAKFAPEMAVKVGEVMALRRAFDVAAPTAEERWDTETPVTVEEAPKPSLAERVAVRQAEVRELPVDDAGFGSTSMAGYNRALAATTDAVEPPSAATDVLPLPTTSAEFVAFVDRYGYSDEMVKATARELFIQTKALQPGDLERLSEALLAKSVVPA